jgi:hypothetical protein
MYLYAGSVKEATMVTLREVKDRLFLVGYVIAIAAVMSGWIYALGWAALKLIRFV